MGQDKNAFGMEASTLEEEMETFLQMLSPRYSTESQIASSLYFCIKIGQSAEELPAHFISRLVPELIACLHCSSPEVQQNVSGALAKIAINPQQSIIHLIVEKDGITALVRKLKGGRINDQAIWALGNLAACCQNCRNLVMQSGLLSILIECLRTTADIQLERPKMVVWCVRNLVSCRLFDIDHEEFKELIDHLHRIIENHAHDDEALHNSLWTLFYLLKGFIRIKIAFEQPHFIPKIISLLKSSASDVVTPSLKIIRNLLFTGSDYQTTQLLQLGVVSELIALMDSPREGTACEAAWVISLIAMGTEEQGAQLFNDPGLLEKVLLACRSGDPKREAARWTVVNGLFQVDDGAYSQMLSSGAAHVLMQILQENPDANLTDWALLTVQRCLRLRSEHQSLTMETFNEVNLSAELSRLANQPESPDANFHSAQSSSILKEFYPLEFSRTRLRKKTVDNGDGDGEKEARMSRVPAAEALLECEVASQTPEPSI